MNGSAQILRLKASRTKCEAYIYGAWGAVRNLIMSKVDHEDLQPIRLDLFENCEFDRGASRLKEIVWLLVSGLLIDSWLPGSAWRRHLLRLFGAEIGKGVNIKPHVRVKFPWRLKVGDHSWIGEGVWIDNLAEVRIGAHCCLSQGSYFCTGSHDWSDPRFSLITRPIELSDASWVGAKASVGPGAYIGTGAVIAMGSIVTGVAEAWTVYSSTRSEPRRERRVRDI